MVTEIITEKQRIFILAFEKLNFIVIKIFEVSVIFCYCY